jgi:hypothetical protein
MASMTRISRSQKATVASGATVSSVVRGGDVAGYGIEVPSTFDGTQIQFLVCRTEGGTYQGLYDDTNTRIAWTVAASRSYPAPTELYAWPFWKIECLTAQATTDTDFYVVSKS